MCGAFQGPAFPGGGQCFSALRIRRTRLSLILQWLWAHNCASVESDSLSCVRNGFGVGGGNLKIGCRSATTPRHQRFPPENPRAGRRRRGQISTTTHHNHINIGCGRWHLTVNESPGPSIMLGVLWREISGPAAGAEKARLPVRKLYVISKIRLVRGRRYREWRARVFNSHNPESATSIVRSYVVAFSRAFE